MVENLDQVKNFVRVNVDGTHTDTDTEINIDADDIDELPDPADGEYNLVWWDTTEFNLPENDPNTEIVRATSIDYTDNILAVERAQEDTEASSKGTEDRRYQLIMAPTAKMFADIEAFMEETDERLDETLDETLDIISYKQSFNSIRNRRDWIEYIFNNEEQIADEVTASQVLTHYIFEAENDKYDRFIDPNHDLGLNAYNNDSEPVLSSVYEAAMFLAPTSFYEGLMTIESVADHVTNSELLMDAVMTGDKILENQFGKPANA